MMVGKQDAFDGRELTGRHVEQRSDRWQDGLTKGGMASRRIDGCVEATEDSNKEALACFRNQLKASQHIDLKGFLFVAPPGYLNWLIDTGERQATAAAAKSKSGRSIHKKMPQFYRNGPNIFANTIFPILICRLAAGGTGLDHATFCERFLSLMRRWFLGQVSDQETLARSSSPTSSNIFWDTGARASCVIRTAETERLDKGVRCHRVQVRERGKSLDRPTSFLSSSPNPGCRRPTQIGFRMRSMTALRTDYGRA